jgi:hypothetical protein
MTMAKVEASTKSIVWQAEIKAGLRTLHWYLLGRDIQVVAKKVAERMRIEHVVGEVLKIEQHGPLKG